VNIQDQEFELEDFSQDGDAVLLHKHLVRKYPGAHFKVCYEAGFSGFTAQRYLSSKGIDCLVVNAADVSTTDRDKRRKTDRIDARKLCDHLQSRKAKGVYVPLESWEHSRSLVRSRCRIVSDQTRCKNRIWQLLHFSGLALPKGYNSSQYWSRRFLKELEALDCGSKALKASLDLCITNYRQTRTILLAATRAIRQMCTQQEYAKQTALLRSIPGVGQINAAVMLFELQEITRFRHIDQLNSYAGLIPDIAESGDHKVVKGITHRANHFLRAALVESSWAVIRKDPAMLMKYKAYSQRMNKNKAIIRIAKHLLSRIMFVLKNNQEYETGVVQ
jgi:transposase